jgi:uncharacterized protein (DUF1697 family)
MEHPRDMNNFVSLLRGINVGGNKKIQMAELKSLYESLGFGQVKTFLQSGNVTFHTQQDDTEQITSDIESAIVQQFGFESKILLRTSAQLQAIYDNHPFTDDQLANPNKILVTFLKHAPDSLTLKAFQQAHTGTEIIHSNGLELYLYYPDGMGTSTLTNNLIERKLNLIATGRNWNTLNKLWASFQS